MAGNFNRRVALDKGPIHDIAWSPNSEQFGTVFGCKLAILFLPVFKSSCQICLLKRWPLTDVSAPFTTLVERCTILSRSTPRGRLLFLDGFCDLVAKIDIFDRHTLNRAYSIDVPDTFYYFRSPDRCFLLIATLSPRLLVDNGIKIWHATGLLVHAQAVEELCHASWCPTPVDQMPPFG